MDQQIKLIQAVIPLLPPLPPYGFDPKPVSQKETPGTKD